MGIVKKVKRWWRSTTTNGKILYILSGISTAASLAAVAASFHTLKEVEDTKFEVKLYPEGKDDPNPITLKGE